MKRWLTLWLLVLVCGLAAPVRAQLDKQRVSIEFRATPLREALRLLCDSARVDYVLDPAIPDEPISVKVTEMLFPEALAAVLRGTSRPISIRIEKGVYHLAPAPEEAAMQYQLDKIRLQFNRAEDVAANLNGLLPRGILTLTTTRADNSLIVRGTPEALGELQQLIHLVDVPARPLNLVAAVTGPGVDGRGIQVKSTARTLNNQEVVMEEEGRVNGTTARLRVRVKPRLNGDNTLAAETEWNVSLPVAGGKAGPVRLVKRLTATNNLAAGQSLVVASVDLAPYGSMGTVRFWLKVSPVDVSFPTAAYGPEGESLGFVQMREGEPYLPVVEFAALLNQGLRVDAATGTYVVEAGAPPAAELARNAAAPPAPRRPGPYQLVINGKRISNRVRVGVLDRDAPNGSSERDQANMPWVPLADVARALGGRLQQDPDKGGYIIVGNTGIRTLRR